MWIMLLPIGIAFAAVALRWLLLVRPVPSKARAAQPPWLAAGITWSAGAHDGPMVCSVCGKSQDSPGDVLYYPDGKAGGGVCDGCRG